MTKKTVYRDSETGPFVTPKYAEAHKATTEKEQVSFPRSTGVLRPTRRGAANAILG